MRRCASPAAPRCDRPEAATSAKAAAAPPAAASERLASVASGSITGAASALRWALLPTRARRRFGLAERLRRSVRTAGVWDLLGAALADIASATGRDALDVVDAGGGTGGFAVPLAEGGP